MQFMYTFCNIKSNFELCSWLYDKYKQQQNSLAFLNITWFFSFKSAMYHTTNCWLLLHWEHVIIRWQRDERRWKICDKRTGGAFAREQECKVLNCSTQEGTANPQSKNPYAAAWFTWCIFSYTICWLSQRPHVWSWNLKVSWNACIQANATVSSEFGGDVFSRFRFQVGWLEPDTFWPTLYSCFATEKTTFKVSKQQTNQHIKSLHNRLVNKKGKSISLKSTTGNKRLTTVNKLCFGQT